MHGKCLVLAMGAFFFIGCSAPGPRVTSGSNAVLSPDGLHAVEGIRTGTLFIRPNYVFGDYPAFLLGPTAVTFKQGSRVLEDSEVKDLIGSFEAVARATIGGTGLKEEAERGPCVAVVQLGLVDLDLMHPSKIGPPQSDGLRMVGAATLVLEIRDGHTGQALLRYGQRHRLTGRTNHVRGKALVAIFERFSTQVLSFINN